MPGNNGYTIGDFATGVSSIFRAINFQSPVVARYYADLPPAQLNRPLGAESIRDFVRGENNALLTHAGTFTAADRVALLANTVRAGVAHCAAQQLSARSTHILSGSTYSNATLWGTVSGFDTGNE